MREQLWLIAVFYIALLFATSDLVATSADGLSLASAFYAALMVVMRACVFQVAYGTYDFACSTIWSTCDPDNV